MHIYTIKENTNFKKRKILTWLIGYEINREKKKGTVTIYIAYSSFNLTFIQSFFSFVFF